METIKLLGVIIIAFAIGVFALSNIMLPFFYTIPRIKKEKRNGNIIKPIPILYIIWAPITWTLLLALGLYLINKFLPLLTTQVYIGLGVAFLMVLNRLFNKHKDLESDFMDVYKDFIKL